MAEGKRVSLEKGYWGCFLGESKFRDGRGLILSRSEGSEKRQLHGGDLGRNFLFVL